MNTAEFLRLILPTKGYYILAVRPAGKDYYNQKAFTSTDEMAAMALRASAAGANAFHACSAFEKPEYQVEVKGEMVTKKRTKENVLCVRSQWMDLDGDQRTNITQLVSFCKEHNFPRPNVFVNSGNGVHVYWVFDRDITRDQWVKSASVFKAMMAHFCIGQQDTTRTADESSVLRPIGCTNDKSFKGLGIKEVKLIGEPNLTPVSFTDWVRKLVSMQAEFGFTTPRRSEPKDNINSDLGGGLDEYPKSSAVVVAEHCAQLRAFRDFSGAGQSEPLWRMCIGVVKHCVEGEPLVHEWSAGHDGYDAGECQNKIDGWVAGPTLCDSFRSENPTVCEGCPHSCKSPVQLGRIAPEAVTEIVEADEETGEAIVDDIPSFPESVLARFRPTRHGLEGKTQDGEGVVSWVRITNVLPIPCGFFQDKETGQFNLQMTVRVRAGVWREAVIPMKAMGQGGTALLGELSCKGFVVACPGRQKMLEEYMKTFAESLSHGADETAMHDHMGWMPDGSFVFGSQRYMPDGTVKTIVLKDSVRRTAGVYNVRGSLSRYVELIDHAYNRPRHQEYQFTWMAGFASPLVALMHNEPVGLIFSAWSPESGKGKSTVATMAGGVWYQAMNTLQANRTTPHALYVTAGTRRNLPLVVDEVTAWEAQRYADFAYDYQSGRGKAMGTQDGGLRDNAHINWTNCAIITSNKSLHEALTNLKANSTPQIMRIFEYRFTLTDAETMSAEEGMRVFTELREIHGVAGEAFLRYIVPNSELVRQALHDAYVWFANKSELGKDARYWLTGAAVQWVAFSITKKLGMHSFDSALFRDWILQQLKVLSRSARNSIKDMAMVFGDMLSDMQGGFIVTAQEGHKSSGEIVPIAPGFAIPRGEVTGRVLLVKKRAYLKFSAVRDWCVKNGIGVSEMRGELKRLGWLMPVARYSLGRGTNINIGQTRVWEIDISTCMDTLPVSERVAEEEAA